MTTALAKANQFGTEDITSMLRELGMTEATTSNRITVDGLVFQAGDEYYTSDPKGLNPAFTARIVAWPDEYQALWIDDSDARELGRANDAGTFCKSYFGKADQAREYSESGFRCRDCAANPFTKSSPLQNGKKCQWKGDLQLQILDKAGELTDPTLWTLTLSTTGMIEWKGSGKAPEKGSVTDKNFLYRLGEWGAEQTPDDPRSGAMAALTALSLGRVVAEFRLLRTQNEDKSRSWSVVSARPVFLLDIVDQPALPAGSGVSDEDIPF